MAKSRFTPKALGPALGKSFVRRLTEDPVLTIGDRSWTRDLLVREAVCGNFAAARRLQWALAKLGITDLAQMNGATIEQLASVSGVGETTIYVLLCVQDALNLTQSTWPNTWRTYLNNAKDAAKAAKRAKGKARG